MTQGSKGGRPKHEPTPEQRKTVEAVAGYGIPHDDIAKLIGIDPKTLRLHYRQELDLGSIKANAKIAESLFKSATQGNTTSQIWWTKCRMGWKETVVNELVGKDGGPIETKQMSAVDALESRIAALVVRDETTEDIVGSDGKAD